MSSINQSYSDAVRNNPGTLTRLKISKWILWVYLFVRFSLNGKQIWILLFPGNRDQRRGSEPLHPGYGGPNEEFHAGEVKSLLLSNNRSLSGEDKNLCFVNSAWNILRCIPQIRYIIITLECLWVLCHNLWMIISELDNYFVLNSITQISSWSFLYSKTNDANWSFISKN